MTRTPEVPLPQDAEVLALRDRLGAEPSALLNVLLEFKQRDGELSASRIREISRAYAVPEQRVSGMASFYSLLSTGREQGKTLRLCDGVACWMQGANELSQHCAELARESDWEIVKTSCLGLCDHAPAALHDHCQLGKLSQSATSLKELLAIAEPHDGHLPVARPGETRFLLRRPTNHPVISTTNSDFLGSIFQNAPQAVLKLLEQSDLHGRGGAGYPTSRKWQLVASVQAEQKYVVCNADESEPLSIKDRTLIDADPLRVIEGMLIAGFTVGANRGVIYIRGEYETQAHKLEKTIREARNAGWLGEGLFNSSFSFEIELHRGAGAYICGEETALLESLEGRRGEPRPRPPYPGQTGLHQAPTLVNNVETLCLVAALCEYGIDEYRQIQHGDAVGTKLYSLFGSVQNTGLFEAPYGLTLGELIESYGGGTPPGQKFSFALVGGAAGTFVGVDRWSDKLEYSLDQQSIPLGTGGILVADSSVSVPETLHEVLRFFERESCGQCTPCRIGTREARLLLDRLLMGTGQPADLNRLEELNEALSLSLCGLGTSVPNPVRSALSGFRPQFEALLDL